MIRINRQQRIAVRKFVAVPLTISVATIGSVMAAYFTDSAYQDTDSTYLLALIFGLVFSAILAISIKSMLIMRGHFKLDYIFFGQGIITLVVSSLSFILHVLFSSVAT